MDLEREYPALTDLMMSGFHLDFWDFHESPEEVVSTFTRDPIFCARIPLEVESLLGEFAGPDREERLDEILWKLTNNYDYDEEGITASAWLIAVRDQVVAETPSVEMIDALVGARVLGATGGKVLTVQTDAGSIRYRGGALVRALGRGRVFARGEGSDVVSTAVGETILVAYDNGERLRLATRPLRLVSHTEGRRPHWTFTRVTS
ncbi:contact-dependent growth inhibition system immunity protein [Janibacter indicus]